MKCKEHPRYKGLKQPRGHCHTCWAIFLGMHEACINCGCQQNECDEAVDDGDGGVNRGCEQEGDS